jgi:hypothetical protein
MSTAANLAPSSGHIFLSHAGADTRAAREFADILRRNGLDVWFDKDNLQPGDNWQVALEDAISRASAMIVYIGSLDIQTWVDREVRFGLVRNTRNREAFRFIPVLGAGADPTRLPPFVQQHQCVDLRDSQRAPVEMQRLLDALRKSSPAQATIQPEYWTTHSPFRSLRVFAPEDSWLFFGRDRNTAELITRLGRAPTLAVIGNSGSGKSSLIQAGLIPALRGGSFRSGGNPAASWRIAVFRPSAAPFDYLAESLPAQLCPELSPKERADLTDYCKTKLPQGGEALRNVIVALAGSSGRSSANERILLVADQFEELFTLVESKTTRPRYIESLLAAARLDAAVPVHLVLGLRADFYAHCLDHPRLSAAIDTNLYNVPGISPPQLREAIESRLALASAAAEPGLADSLLADVGTEPGNLALLEHALAQLWERSAAANRLLTSDAYAAIGRLRGALGKHADAVYAGLAEADRPLAQSFFLELVQLGEGAQDSRRRVPKHDLLQLGAPEQVERVIASLAGERLLTTSGQGPPSPENNFVEVSHEALIREWPMLREWLSESREDLRLGRRLRQSAEEWEVLNRDPSALLRGVKLTQAEEWTAKHPHAAAGITDYVNASLDARRESEELERLRMLELQELSAENERLKRELDARVANAEYQFGKESAAGSPLVDKLGIEERPYGAFFLYSHSKDKSLAASLQRSLERFATPWYASRRLRIFRDETDLAASPALWSSITSVLDKSKYIVLLASPEAASSSWVNREVRYWLEHRSETEILIALTDGQLAWDGSAGDFDWNQTDALPQSLRGVFRDEPLYVDLRWARTESEFDLGNPRFRSAVASLAAPIIGRAVSELVHEEIRERRRRRIVIAICVLITLLMMALAFAISIIQLQHAVK